MFEPELPIELQHGDDHTMDSAMKVGMVVLSGNSHPKFTKLITDRLDIPTEMNKRASVLHSSNKETTVEIRESIRRKDVYIVQTGTKNVNDDIMELMLMAYACRTSSARNIVGVIPYLPYCKQSKMRKRGSIVSRLLADLFTKAGFSRIITMDLHQKEIQGFYSIPIDNLRASSFLVQYITESIPDYRNAVIVAKGPQSVNRATSFANRLQLSIAVIHGDEKTAEADKDDGRTSPPPQRSRIFPVEFNDLPAMARKEKPPMNVVGDVDGKIAIIVDDMIDEVESFISVAEVLRETGAYRIYVIATHGLLSLDGPQLIEESCIDEVIVTNTIPHEVQKLQCTKIKTVDVSRLFVEAIRRIHNQESMAMLFQNEAND